jgi:hypothetical protein
MSCKNCDCLDCRTEEVLARVQDMTAEMEEDENVMPAWAFAGKANDGQALAWGHVVDTLLNQYGPTIHVRTMISVVMYKLNVRLENQASLGLQVERFFNENYSIAKDKKVGTKLQYIEMRSMANVPDLITGATESFTIKSIKNDYTCPCGNNKCSKVEKSCWKCGAPIKP